VKVALLSDWYLPRMGGLELHLYDLSRELAERGCQVVVITPTRAASPDRPRRFEAVELPSVPGVRVERLGAPLLPRYGLVYTRSAFRELSSLLVRERIDLLQCMVSIITPAAIGGVAVGKQLGLPTVATFHSMLTGFRPVLSALDRAVGWSRWPVVFSAVSEAVARDARRLVGGRPVHLLPNGVHPEAWRISRTPRPSGELRLISVMRLNHRKRGAALLRAVARVRSRLGGSPRVRLTVVGDGPERRLLRGVARALGLGDALRFTGHLARRGVREELARADVFVLASSLESFGIAALEARAAGLPVVALDRGGVKEFLRHDADALLASSDSGLVESLVRLARDESLLARLRAGAAETPVPCSWDDSARRHLEVYEEALGTRGAGLLRRAAPRVTAVHPAPPIAVR
jgi:glycosyltransferase involved in cell wall biosynthesis